MDLGSAFVGAGASLINSFFGNEAAKGAATDANKHNWKVMEHQMAFQEKMRNNAHQREVEDLKAAGLNPALSAGGSGAPMASGSAPAAAHANLTPPIQLPDIFQAISLAQAEKKLKNESDRTVADVAKSQADTEYIRLKKELEGRGVLKSLDNAGGEIIRKILKFLTDNPKQKIDNIKSKGNPFKGIMDNNTDGMRLP